MAGEVVVVPVGRGGGINVCQVKCVGEGGPYTSTEKADREKCLSLLAAPLSPI